MLKLELKATSARPLLRNAIELICDLLGADGGFVGQRIDNRIEPLVDYNAPGNLGEQIFDASQFPARNFHEAFAFRAGDPLLRPYDPLVPMWRYNLAIAVKCAAGRGYPVLVVGRDYGRPFPLDSRLYARLGMVRQLLRETFRLVSGYANQLEVGTARESRLAEPRSAFFGAPATAKPDSGATALVDFLFETLVRSRTISTAGDLGYTTLRRWRSPLKPHQLSAMRALKREREPELVARIVGEIGDWIEIAYGKGMFDAVVAVPCGHSGSDCLSAHLGAGLAQRLQIAHVTAFRPLSVTGSSHPRTNATRPSMTLIERPRGHVVVVDDIATSGSHITEAMRLLRPHARSVAGIAWIGDR